ncbi:hypothetical protein [Klebsiella pneumoniae]
MTMWQKSAAICAAVITKPTSQKAMTAMKPVTKLSVKSAVSKALIRTALTTAARITLMTDITELAQREKFEAWFKSSFHPDKTGPYIKDQLYFAWKAAGAELVEALEKALRYIEELREWNAGLAQESCERQQRISELLEGKVGNALLERENHHVELVGKLAERIAELESRTVKLPPCVDDLHGIGMVMPADAVIEMLAAAGIKVEAE